MKIVKRDIEIMGWILEQKFMTVEQVQRVFWKDTEGGRKETYRRLLELQREGYLKRSMKSIYRNVLYVVTGKGSRLLKVFGRDRGLREVFDMDYLNYKHDAVVTDLRILFHEWGYTDWMSERILSKRGDLRRLPDSMIHHQGKYFAIEYESTQKSKNRYRDIFLKYEMDRGIDKVIYVVDTPGELITKLCREAMNYDKLHFVTLDDFRRHQVNAPLKSTGEQHSLHELLEKRVEI